MPSIFAQTAATSGLSIQPAPDVNHVVFNRTRWKRIQYPLDETCFLGRLTQGAQRVDRPSRRQVMIQSAAKQACCSAADIVRLILEERLGWVVRRKASAATARSSSTSTTSRTPCAGPAMAACRCARSHTSSAPPTASSPRSSTAITLRPSRRETRSTAVRRRWWRRRSLRGFRRGTCHCTVLAKERKRHHLAMKIELDDAGVRSSAGGREVLSAGGL